MGHFAALLAFSTAAPSTMLRAQSHSARLSAASDSVPDGFTARVAAAVAHDWGVPASGLVLSWGRGPLVQITDTSSFKLLGLGDGGWLAVVLDPDGPRPAALRLRDRGLAGRFSGAALQFGTYDVSGLTPAGELITDEYFIQAYVGHVPDRTVPDISPVYGDLHGLPPLLMVVGSADVLVDDNRAMAARVSAAGGVVDLRIYPEAPHAFTNWETDKAKAARHDIECGMKRWLDEAR